MDIEEKCRRFKDVYSGLFPAVDTRPHKSGNDRNGEIEWNYFFYNIPPQNRSFHGSPYFFEGKFLLHFTKYKSLRSIISNKNLRLSSLSCLKDPLEFHYAGKILKINPKSLTNAREGIFQSSFCERKILNEPANEFNMWRLYGDDGKGAIIEFEISNSPLYWSDFHLSKVYYGTLDKKLINMLDIKDEINKSSEIMGFDFGKIIPFHKSQLYSYENEVRIIYDRRIDRTGLQGVTFKSGDETLFPVVKAKQIEPIFGEQQKTMELPVFHKDFYMLCDEIPVLRINRIILGYNSSFEKRKKSLAKYCMAQLGYIPEIERTGLHGQYWGNIDRNFTSK